MERIFSITVPAEEGFIGRQCADDKCGGYFKIHKTLSGNKKVICPYCGSKHPINITHTPQQINYALERAQEKITEECSKKLQDMISKAFPRSGGRNRSDFGINMSVKHTPYHKPVVFPSKENKMDSSFKCSECSNSFQVYGIFGYCPACGYGDIKIYDANLSAIKRQLKQGVNQQKAMRIACSDIVSVFESFCKKYLRNYKTSSFQDLMAVESSLTNYGCNIYENISSKDQLSLRRIFAARHVYIHNQGIVDAGYIKLVPEDRGMLGKKAGLSARTLISGARALKIVINNIIQFSIARRG